MVVKTLIIRQRPRQGAQDARSASERILSSRVPKSPKPRQSRLFERGALTQNVRPLRDRCCFD